MTTAASLDPNLLEALEYFRSNAVESTERLKVMLDEAIESSKRRHSKEFFAKSAKCFKSVKIPVPGMKLLKGEGSSLQKRSLDKVQVENNDGNPPDVFKKGVTKAFASGSIMTSSGIHLHKPNSSPSATSPSTNGMFKKSPLSTPSLPDDLVIDANGLSCSACKESSVGTVNKLVECQECHVLYHQGCHQPPVKNAELKDPRYIWYCSKCKLKMKVQEKPHLLHSSEILHIAENSHDQLQDTLPEVKTKTSVTPFKRSAIKPVASSNNVATSLSGWATLSGKTAPFKHEATKPVEIKRETPVQRALSLPKEKTKSPKNHTKSPQSKFSDAWAEALCVRTLNEKQKSSVNSSSDSKHLSSSAVQWHSKSGNNKSNKQKSSKTNPTEVSKHATFLKSSTVSSQSPKTTSVPVSTTKHMHVIKKKTHPKMQQNKFTV